MPTSKVLTQATIVIIKVVRQEAFEEEFGASQVLSPKTAMGVIVLKREKGH